jgi:hypothetical protein
LNITCNQPIIYKTIHLILNIDYIHISKYTFVFDKIEVSYKVQVH